MSETEDWEEIDLLGEGDAVTNEMVEEGETDGSKEYHCSSVKP